MDDKLIIKGARSHNLKNINVEIPKHQLVVITGLSGSGKSSLAFDTIYAEGQRKYVESLSAYARQFLGMMEKADVDSITGLSPAISIDQKTSGHNPRSTVGTITEIYDYLRLLFARAGHPRNPKTGNRLQSQSVQQIVDAILNLPIKYNLQELKVMILAPVVKKRKGTYDELFQRFLAQGYVRVRVDDKLYSLEEEIKLDRYKIHNIEIIIDRLQISKQSLTDKDFIKRVTDSVESAINLGDRELYVNIVEQNEDIFFSEKLVDPQTGESFGEIEPHTFSFNSPYGACAKCSGLGSILEIDPLQTYNPNLTISEGGLFPWSKMADNKESWHMQLLTSVATAEGFSLKTPLGELSKQHLDLILFGSQGKKYKIDYHSQNRDAHTSMSLEYEGMIPNLTRRYKETDSDYIRREIGQYMKEIVCPLCEGLRLRAEALAVTIENTNIVEVTNLALRDLDVFLNKLKSNEPSNSEDALSNQEKTIVTQVVKEIESRVHFLLSVGLDYLTLSRKAKTLSGGESQRIRLASQIGTNLSGVLYVLDEPSIGLHQRDNQRLIDTLRNLKNLGNSIIVVEHDKDTMLQSDYLIDMGPGAGEHGGNIVSQGTPNVVMNDPNSITGQYLADKKKLDKDEIRKQAFQLVKTELNHKILPDNTNVLKIIGAQHNNLKDVDVEIPLGKFVVVSGVSGSGKSSLINEILVKALSKHFYRSKDDPGLHKRIDGLENIDKMIAIDQTPIGRTPRSNPATYTGIFTHIRELFALSRESQVRGYTPGRFSFNVRGGRCETCQGDGVIKIEMQFLADVYIECEVCKGKRYNRETLQVDYKGKNISEILDMTVETALEFFASNQSISTKLITLKQVGLDYLKLGQFATTLSGGEAQRIKLAAELSKRSTGKTLYVLDEPTTGLHFEDLHKLLIVLHSLVLKGNSVLIIEHNLDLIKTADWIIDLGPEGGEQGGQIIVTGTPAQVAKYEKSYTGQWLAKIT